MPAGERAGLRHFPVDIHGRPGVIARAHGEDSQSARSYAYKHITYFGSFYSKKRLRNSGVWQQARSRFPNQAYRCRATQS